MTDRLHLEPEHRAILETLLREHLPGVEVWAYGSRVNGRSHDGSDLDLVLRGPRLEEIPIDRLVDFEEAVRESSIPFLVEARDWARVPERFHREIERERVVLTGNGMTKRGWLFHPPFPAYWQSRSLYSMATWTNGIAFRDIQFSETGRPVIKIAEIKRGISGQTKFTRQIFDESVLVRSGDLLFSWSGQPEISIDAFWWRGPEGWLNQHIFKVTPIAELHVGFFYYLLRYLNSNFIGIARNKQTTGLGHVTRRDLENMEVAYPDFAEQRAIAHILGTLDERIELNRRMNRTLEAMARAIFKDWFVDFGPVRAKMEGRDTALPQRITDLFPDRFVDSELGEIPEEWKAMPLSDLLEVNPGRSLRKGELAPYLDMANMPTESHIPHTVSERPFGSGMRFMNGDTIVARITPCLENGKTAYVDFLQEGDIGWGSTEYIILRPRSPLPNEFAYFLARSPQFREFAIQNMTGTRGRQRVQGTALSQLLVPNPTKRVADAFRDQVRGLMARISAADRESRSLVQTRDVLVPSLISGDIRICEAERLIGETA